MAEQTKKPMGRLIEWSDEDLEKMAEVTSADIKRAVALWKNGIQPPALKSLLDADAPKPAVIRNGT